MSQTHVMKTTVLSNKMLKSSDYSWEGLLFPYIFHIIWCVTAVGLFFPYIFHIIWCVKACGPIFSIYFPYYLVRYGGWAYFFHIFSILFGALRRVGLFFPYIFHIIWCVTGVGPIFSIYFPYYLVRYGCWAPVAPVAPPPEDTWIWTRIWKTLIIAERGWNVTKTRHENNSTVKQNAQKHWL